MQKFFVFLFVLVFIVSCTVEDEYLADSVASGKSVEGDEHAVSLDDALLLAAEALGKSDTRSTSFPSVEYIISPSSPRAANAQKQLNDTLAYVINYANDGGFAVISADNRVRSVLAYAETGSFSMENENVVENFVNRLPGYFAAYIDSITIGPRPPIFESRYVEPLPQMKVGQGSPWNTYVEQYHPGCPVGCVPVATALMLCHTMKVVALDGITYHTRSIVNGIVANWTMSDWRPAPDIPGVEYKGPFYNKLQATDWMAKLLCHIGNKLNVKYDTNSSAASSSDAYTFCDTLGLEIPSRYAGYNINDVGQYVMDGYVVYMRGSVIGERYGHAWVVDGITCDTSSSYPGELFNVYLHCDWGWYGNSNGFFAGDIFSVHVDVQPTNYFAIKHRYQIR